MLFISLKVNTKEEFGFDAMSLWFSKVIPLSLHGPLEEQFYFCLSTLIFPLARIAHSFNMVRKGKNTTQHLSYRFIVLSQLFKSIFFNFIFLVET